MAVQQSVVTDDEATGDTWNRYAKWDIFEPPTNEVAGAYSGFRGTARLSGKQLKAQGDEIQKLPQLSRPSLDECPYIAETSKPRETTRLQVKCHLRKCRCDS